MYFGTRMMLGFLLSQGRWGLGHRLLNIVLLLCLQISGNVRIACVIWRTIMTMFSWSPGMLLGRNNPWLLHWSTINLPAAFGGRPGRQLQRARGAGPGRPAHGTTPKLGVVPWPPGPRPESGRGHKPLGKGRAAAWRRIRGCPGGEFATQGGCRTWLAGGAPDWFPDGPAPPPATRSGHQKRPTRSGPREACSKRGVWLGRGPRIPSRGQGATSLPRILSGTLACYVRLAAGRP